MPKGFHIVIEPGADNPKEQVPVLGPDYRRKMA